MFYNMKCLGFWAAFLFTDVYAEASTKWFPFPVFFDFFHEVADKYN